MEKLHKFFKEMFPKIPFTTKIKVDELVGNKIESEDPERRTGLLFSGGVDSFYTLINNIHHNPQLVMLWGVDDFPYPERADHWEKTISIYREYAERKKLELYILKTNISQILDSDQIWHSYYKELCNGVIRATLGHSTVLLGPAAPISINRFNRLIIAASNIRDYDYQLKPNGAHPDADEKIIWADLSVKHDGLVKRIEKFNRIVDYHGDEDFILRVCTRSAFVDGKVNDSRCFKCLHTIMRLILIGLDPNKCGFKVDESTFEFLKSQLRNKHWATTYAGALRKIQKVTPDQVGYDVSGSNEFFEWFRELDLETLEKKEKNWFYTDLYMWLPLSLAKILEQVYYKYGITLDRWTYNKEYARAREEA
jgi:hypothetical protein